MPPSTPQTKRCQRNRKRSKRRAILCPIHGCYLDSVSQKYRLFADRAGQLQERGVPQKYALMLIASKTTVAIEGEWLEAFWCSQCQESKWYHVCKSGDRIYKVSLAPAELWQQVTGVIDPNGNSSVGEFTRRQSKRIGFYGVKDFGAI
ncbi:MULTISPECIES: hypothetical protein [Moorena]|uniref:Uncharacterized protein n=1 Tax=Moorena producens 3L TaxID=489825 RepID=F4XY59_9CYAN|nr:MULTISPECIES: hypothetical protein [Moorena]EGJ30456.1 hypothetical protein LYNGBM3L_50160 [Moorena producens 3L]NEP65886.1 hypothetical protein [Moorena sp. SIO3A5]NEQ10092.1 hypothetical protein [Moorena sp. SIO4E2]NER87374.1 hypothetical protein [Moorena sp. SIO3A2]OLT68648.1 hypothetical protein BI334_29810 [Moorena producens 3L]